MEEREATRAQMDGVEVVMDEACGEERGERAAHVKLGRRGELAAQRFLQHMGLEILETNWSCIAGEVDIIARDDFSLHFVEVKTRRGTGRGFPAEAVTPEKRRRYERIAELYLEHCDAWECQVRFDIISILALDSNKGFLKMYSNAFSCDW